MDDDAGLPVAEGATGTEGEAPVSEAMETPTAEAPAEGGEPVALASEPETGSRSSRRRWSRGGRPANRPAAGPAPAGGGAVYGLGMIGALVYFVAIARDQRDYLLAFPKAMVWPAIMVYRLFRFLGE